MKKRRKYQGIYSQKIKGECVREREIERERGRDIKRERGRERELQNVSSDY